MKIFLALMLLLTCALLVLTVGIIFHGYSPEYALGLSVGSGVMYLLLLVIIWENLED